MLLQLEKHNLATILHDLLQYTTTQKGHSSAPGFLFKTSSSAVPRLLFYGFISSFINVILEGTTLRIYRPQSSALLQSVSARH